jgi:hypothetical protein
VKFLTVLRDFRATMSRAQVQGGIGMRHATKRATSEAVAHLLAVMAMLVIASVLFYRVEKSSQSKAQAVRQIEQSAH